MVLYGEVRCILVEQRFEREQKDMRLGRKWPVFLDTRQLVRKTVVPQQVVSIASNLDDDMCDGGWHSERPAHQLE